MIATTSYTNLLQPQVWLQKKKVSLVIGSELIVLVKKY